MGYGGEGRPVRELAISAVLMATMREIARSLEERITLHEELVTAAVPMAITRGIARCL